MELQMDEMAVNEQVGSVAAGAQNYGFWAMHLIGYRRLPLFLDSRNYVTNRRLVTSQIFSLLGNFVAIIANRKRPRRDWPESSRRLIRTLAVYNVLTHNLTPEFVSSENENMR